MFLNAVASADPMGGASSDAPAVYRHQIESMVTYADLIVSGTVVDLWGQRIPVQWVAPGDTRKDKTLPSIWLVLQIDEVFKGEEVPDPVEVVVVGGFPGVPVGLTDVSYDYQVGDEVVLAVKYWDGNYVLVTDASRFNGDSEGNWASRLDERIVVDSPWFREVAAKTGYVAIAREADVIAVGRVSEKHADWEDAAFVEHIVLDIDDVWKGDTSSSHIEFAVIRRSGDALSWKREVPRLELQEQWLVFLKNGPAGLFPFAGDNGMFRVEEGALIRAGRVRVRVSREELGALVREVDR